jgi:hypothetical protein
MTCGATRLLMSAIWLGACQNPSPDASVRSSAMAGPHATAAAVEPAAAAAPSGHGAPPVTVAWRGTYHSATATLYVPSEWKSVHWKVPETPQGVGDGTLELTVDPATHRVLGTLDGPLGPATIDGFASGHALTATLARKDPADRGFAGTLVGVVDDDAVTGVVHAALAEASAIRTATFSLSRSSL